MSKINEFLEEPKVKKVSDRMGIFLFFGVQKNKNFKKTIKKLFPQMFLHFNDKLKKKVKEIIN